MDKYCTKCGALNISREGGMNFDPNTGEPRNHWKETKCPFFIWILEADGNGHFYDYEDDVNRYPTVYGVAALIAVLLFIIIQSQQ